MEVAKLYATLGFNIKDDGLAKFQAQVTDIAQKIKEVQKATKVSSTAQKESTKAKIDDEKVEQQRLKTLQALAKLDTAKARQALQESKLTLQQTKLEDYEANKQEKAEAKRLKDRQANWMKFFGGIAGAAAIVAEASKKSFDQIIESSKGAVSYKTFSLQTGFSLKTAEKFQAALAPYGLSKEEVLNDLNNMQQNLANVKLNKGNVAAFKTLGLSIDSGDIRDIINQIQQNMPTYNKYQRDVAANLFGEIGISAPWQRAFAENAFANVDISSMLSEEQVNNLEEMNKTWGKFLFEWSNFKDKLSAAFSPGTKAFLEGGIDFFKWLGEFCDAIDKWLRNVGGNLGRWIRSKDGGIPTNMVDENGNIDIAPTVDYLLKQDAQKQTKIVNNVDNRIVVGTISNKDLADIQNRRDSEGWDRTGAYNMAY